MFKKRQTVRQTHPPHRRGEIIEISCEEGEEYPIQVDFGDEDYRTYTAEGLHLETDKTPSIEIVHNREEGFVPQQIEDENTYTLEDLRKAFEAGSLRDCDFQTWNEN